MEDIQIDPVLARSIGKKRVWLAFHLLKVWRTQLLLLLPFTHVCVRVHLRVCACVRACVCACVRASVHACVCVYACMYKESTDIVLNTTLVFFILK